MKNILNVKIFLIRNIIFVSTVAFMPMVASNMIYASSLKDYANALANEMDNINRRYKEKRKNSDLQVNKQAISDYTQEQEKMIDYFAAACWPFVKSSNAQGEEASSSTKNQPKLKNTETQNDECEYYCEEEEEEEETSDSTENQPNEDSFCNIA